MMVSGTSYKAKGLGGFNASKSGNKAAWHHHKPPPFCSKSKNCWEEFVGFWLMPQNVHVFCCFLAVFCCILDACAQLALSSGQRHRSACLGASSP